MTEQSTGVSRRRIIQGAAWATPAILVASAAPALATSPVPTDATLTVTHSGDHKATSLVFSVSVKTVLNAFDPNFYVVTSAGDPTKVTSVAVSNNTAWSGGATAVNGVGMAAGTTSNFTITIHYQSNNDHGTSTFRLYDDSGALIATAVA